MSEKKKLRHVFLVWERGEKHETNFTDDVLSVEENEADLASDLLKNYKAKVEFYIQQHQNSGAISKLKNNIPLNQSDWQELEHTLWNELGSREDYEAEYGTEPLGKFILFCKSNCRIYRPKWLAGRSDNLARYAFYR